MEGGEDAETPPKARSSFCHRGTRRPNQAADIREAFLYVLSQKMSNTPGQGVIFSCVIDARDRSTVTIYCYASTTFKTTS